MKAWCLGDSSRCTCWVMRMLMKEWACDHEEMRFWKSNWMTLGQTVSRSALNWGNSRAKVQDRIKGYMLKSTFTLSQRRALEHSGIQNTHLLFLWTVMVMVALGYGGCQGGSLRLQVAEAQRQGEGQGKSIWYGEWGGQQEEEDEKEAGDEWWRLNGQKVLCTLREETHIGQIREGDVTVFIQDRGHVGQVQGEWEECATMIPALLQSLLSCREQQGLLI